MLSLTSIIKLSVDRIHLGTALPILQDIVPNYHSCVYKYTLSPAEGLLSTGLLALPTDDLQRPPNLGWSYTKYIFTKQP